jgi:sarcosine oxidase
MERLGVLDAQVGVVGLGAAGSSALWRTAARGATVLGFEQFEIAHSRGSSHGDSRLFRTALAEGPQYVDLVRRAKKLWRELEQESGEDLLGLVGGVSIGSPASEMLATTQATIDAYGLEHQKLTAEELQQRYPQHRVRDGAVGLLDPGTGYIRPEASIAAAVNAARRLGAKVAEQTPVTAVEPDKDGVWIRTTAGDYRVAQVIVSAGAWTSRLLPGLTVPIQVRRAVLSWFRPRAGKEELFLPERFPVFMHDDGSRRGWGAPMLDASGVKVGMHDNGGAPIEDPGANPRQVRPEELKAVTDFVRDTLPDLEPEVHRSHGCMISVTPDEAFSLGYTEAYPNVVVLAACSGHGFKHASAVGDVGAELAVEGQASLDVSAFSPDRFA